MTIHLVSSMAGLFRRPQSHLWAPDVPPGICLSELSVFCSGTCPPTCQTHVLWPETPEEKQSENPPRAWGLLGRSVAVAVLWIASWAAGSKAETGKWGTHRAEQTRPCWSCPRVSMKKNGRRNCT